MKTLLVCLDFSDSTKRILDQARMLAAGTYGRIVLLHVAQPDPDFIGYDSDPQALRDQMAAVYHREGTTLQAHADTLAADTDNVEILPLLVQGAIGEKILEHAKTLDAKMILMGTHNHGRLHDLLVGSTSQYVLQHTATPLLLIPAGEEK